MNHFYDDPEDEDQNNEDAPTTGDHPDPKKEEK